MRIFSAYPNARCIVFDMSEKPKVTAKAEPNRKVNLKALQGSLSKKGKPAYQNPALASDIRSLSTDDPNDAFIWAEAVVTLTGDKTVDNRNKMLWRQRAVSVSESVEIPIRIQWTNDGEMVISRKS